jgi:hypothetical protein
MQERVDRASRRPLRAIAGFITSRGLAYTGAWSVSPRARKLSWHALAGGPLPPPTCLSLKSWPERSDPVHLVTSGRVARLARSRGRWGTTPCMDVPLSSQPAPLTILPAVSFNMGFGGLQCDHLAYGSRLKAAAHRASTTGSRSFHSRTRWTRICPSMVVPAASFSRSRPLTACQGPKQSLLHLHSHSHTLHYMDMVYQLLACLPSKSYLAV